MRLIIKQPFKKEEADEQTKEKKKRSCIFTQTTEKYAWQSQKEGVKNTVTHQYYIEKSDLLRIATIKDTDQKTEIFNICRCMLK